MARTPPWLASGAQGAARMSAGAIGRRGAGLLGVALAGALPGGHGFAQPARPVARPTGTGTITTMRFENAGSRRLEGGFTTFAQVFLEGEVPLGAGVTARIDQTAQPVQLDVRSRWPDGSARYTLCVTRRPTLEPGQGRDVVLALDAAQTQGAVDLRAAVAGLSDFAVRLAFTAPPPPVDGRTAPRSEALGTVTFDLRRLMLEALERRTASPYREGPLCTEARAVASIDRSSMRIIVDVAAFAGGALVVNVQFANDRAMEAPVHHGRVAYQATMVLNGRPVINEAIPDQLQYTTWRRRIATDATVGGQDLGGPGAGWLNIRHDMARLASTGIILHYDWSLPLSPNLLAGFQRAIQAPGFAAPFASLGVARQMPAAGGRADIAHTNEIATAWLISQDARAARLALGWAGVSGAVPWNFWDAANDTWINTINYPKLWSRNTARGLTAPGNRESVTLIQPWEWTSYDGWTPETAHQPDLTTVPYLLTGERWMLDFLNGQAGFALLDFWPGGERDDGNMTNLVFKNAQLRGSVWSLRQFINAEFLNPDGSREKAFFGRVVDDNFTWLLQRLPTWQQQQGEPHGFIPHIGEGGALASWQQDIAITQIQRAARLGGQGAPKARRVAAWMKNFVLGRFEQPPEVFGIRDAVGGGGMVVMERGGRTFHQSWAAISRATIAAGLSQYRPADLPDTGWNRSNQNDFVQIASCTLGQGFHFDGDRRWLDALRRLNSERPPPPWSGRGHYASSPKWAGVPPGYYSNLPSP
jgi:hypothetical protein